MTVTRRPCSVFDCSDVLVFGTDLLCPGMCAPGRTGLKQKWIGDISMKQEQDRRGKRAQEGKRSRNACQIRGKIQEIIMSPTSGAESVWLAKAYR